MESIKISAFKRGGTVDSAFSVAATVSFLHCCRCIKNVNEATSQSVEINTFSLAWLPLVRL